MRLSPLFLAALLLLGGTQSVLAQPNTLNEAEKLSGWELLFDGKTTDGWRNFKKDSINPGWKVENGELIRAEKGAGDIITAKQYDRFELSLEYKIGRAHV